MFSFQKSKCNDSCRFGKQCCQKVSIGAVAKLREKFWNSESKRAPSSKERKTSIETFMKKFFDSATKRFKYLIEHGDEMYEVCEQGWLRLMGKH